MNTILLIAKVLGIVVSKGIDIYNKGGEAKLGEIVEVAHQLHDLTHKHYAEECPEEMEKHPHPDELRGMDG